MGHSPRPFPGPCKGPMQWGAHSQRSISSLGSLVTEPGLDPDSGLSTCSQSQQGPGHPSRHPLPLSLAPCSCPASPATSSSESWTGEQLGGDWKTRQGGSNQSWARGSACRVCFSPAPGTSATMRSGRSACPSTRSHPLEQK